MKFLLIFAFVALVAAVQAFKITFSEKKMTYREAQAHCAKDHTKVARIDSLEKQIQLVEMMKKENVKRAWIGLYRASSPSNDRGPWTWFFEGYPNLNISGYPQYWGVQEPNNFRNHNEQCVEVRDIPKANLTHNWNDAPCDHENYFYCERMSPPLN